jgi:hypothetical protein
LGDFPEPANLSEQKESNTMGNRLTQIATRTGDNGTTGLGNNQQIGRAHV